MLRMGGIAALALLALAACQRPAPTRPAPPSDISGLLRAQGFDFLDIGPEVTISPLCAMQVGPTRYDFFWYEWQQQPENAPGALHAARRLIQLRDGRTYDGYYGVLMPEDRPTCRPDRRELVFRTDPDVVQALGTTPENVVPVGQSGLPDRIWVNGAIYDRDH